MLTLTGADSFDATQILSSDDVRMLAEVGLTAVQRGRINTGRAVADAIAVLRPASEIATVMDALCRMRMKDYAGSAAALRAGPQTQFVRALLGMALLQSGARDESLPVLKEISAPGSPGGELAAALLAGVKLAEDGTPFAFDTIL